MFLDFFIGLNELLLSCMKDYLLCKRRCFLLQKWDSLLDLI